MTQDLVIRIDIADLVKDLPNQITKTEKVIPNGYKCQSCWRDDGGHQPGCQFATKPNPAE